MSEYYGYPENDWRNYLEHSSKDHKYISKHKSKSGKWVYVYDRTIGKVVKEHKRRKALNAARDDINERVFNKYDNYALNDKEPPSEGVFVFRSPDGKEQEWSNTASQYRNLRDYYLKTYGTKKNKKKLKNPWRPTSASKDSD